MVTFLGLKFARIVPIFTISGRAARVAVGAPRPRVAVGLVVVGLVVVGLVVVGLVLVGLVVVGLVW